jgi:hypothetical protein
MSPLGLGLVNQLGLDARLVRVSNKRVFEKEFKHKQAQDYF